MFGLSVLQMTLALKKHLGLISLEGIGYTLPDACSSRFISAKQRVTQFKANGSKTSSGVTVTSSGKRDESISLHVFHWRDLMDLVVRWRQLSEPSEPVWWIDCLPTKAFQEGFGLQTPLVNGHLTTVRYSAYFKPAFDQVKMLLVRGYFSVRDEPKQLGQRCAQLMQKAKDLREVRDLVGEDFYVVMPCPSIKQRYDLPPQSTDPSSDRKARSPLLVMEGTRLTLLTQEADGFEFTIRTPGKPHRWSQYDAEMDACFQRLEELFVARNSKENQALSSGCEPVPPPEGSATCRDKESEDQVLLRHALEFFYLWVTFAPLSRGR